MWLGQMIKMIREETNEESIFYDKLKKQGYDSEQKYQAILNWIKANYGTALTFELNISKGTKK